VPAHAIHSQASQREQDAFAQVRNTKDIKELLYHKKILAVSNEL
jgi:hypothetical protein